MGSHLDRHAPLGKGAIGLSSFVPLIQWAAKNNKPIFLETPEPERRAEEITMIRKIMKGDTDRIRDFHDNHYGSQLLKKFNGQQDTLF